MAKVVGMTIDSVRQDLVGCDAKREGSRTVSFFAPRGGLTSEERIILDKA